MENISFKLIVIVSMAALLFNCQTQEPVGKKGVEFEQILSESTFENWDGDPRFWKVEDGVIVGETSKENPVEENTFLIWEDQKPANFELKFEYRFVKVGGELSGNSGLQFRSERLDGEESSESTYRVRGYQADFAVSDWIPGIHYEERGRGILARRGQKVVIDSDGRKNEERFAGEDNLGKYIDHMKWNEYHIYANRDTLCASINGKLMHEIIDQSPEARKEGILAFQIHTGPPMRVELRNVELKVLN